MEARGEECLAQEQEGSGGRGSLELRSLRPPLACRAKALSGDVESPCIHHVTSNLVLHLHSLSFPSVQIAIIKTDSPFSKSCCKDEIWFF